ncbi:MAG TPA: hypothetical protein VFN66_07775 [Burkholderiales bacterium]|nr:hypothetical protein [Burkholderiales bacterium]
MVNILPCSPTRRDIHKDPQYYRIRNHLVDFLVTRSRELSQMPATGSERRYPPEVKPGEENDETMSMRQPASRPPVLYAI